VRRREEGTIEQRIEGRKYLIRWTCSGCEAYKHTDQKRHNKVVRGDSIEAQNELARMLRPIKDAPAKPERTFASYADKEWAQYTKDKWKGSTQITQGSFVKKWIRPFFDAMPLAAIRPSDIAAFYQSLEDKGLGRKTRRNIHAILSTMFGYATETLELIPKSPVKKGLAPKLQAHEKQSLKPDQVWLLWDALADAAVIRYRAFYGTLLFTGVRTGEALGLKWEDIDLGSRQLTIKRAIYRGKETTPKTKASLRTRPISPELYAALVNHKAMASSTAPTDYVFCSSSGNPMNPDQLRENLQKVLRDKLQIHLGPREDGLHLLRHTSGSLVFNTTGNIKEAQQWLGHSSSRITLDTYVHSVRESQTCVAESVFSRPAVPAVAPEQQN
jgi:integrase